MVPVPEAELPVLLPPIEHWLPGDDGRSPLASLPSFVETRCPHCGGPARRETDTMDGFACSSWYFLRFVSPHYADGPFDPAALAQWGNPDLYVGGAEHAVMHLLYARFWTKVMADAGIVPFREPFPVLRSQGTMHARDPQTGEVRRMSKSAGNVVTPDSVAETHGADALRIYLLFMAPFENNTVWDEEGINGARRFLERTWRLANEVAASRPARQRAVPAGDSEARTGADDAPDGRPGDGRDRAAGVQHRGGRADEVPERHERLSRRAGRHAGWLERCAISCWCWRPSRRTSLRSCGSAWAGVQRARPAVARVGRS